MNFHELLFILIREKNPHKLYAYTPELLSFPSVLKKYNTLFLALLLILHKRIIFFSSREEVHEHIQKYFKDAKGVLESLQDKLELCLLVTHCFEDHYEAEAYSQKQQSIIKYTTNLLRENIDNVLEGMTKVLSNNETQLPDLEIVQ